MTATNSGTGTAHGFKITDTLPTNTGLAWTVDSQTPSSPVCTITTGVLTCGPTDLAGSSATFVVHITSPTDKTTCTTVNTHAQCDTTTDGSGAAPPPTGTGDTTITVK